MKSRVSKSLVACGLGLFIAGLSLFLTEVGIFPVAKAQTITKGKTCQVTRQASRESSQCQNGACPTSVRHYARIGTCVGNRSCYSTCERDLVRDFERYRVDEEWTIGGYLFTNATHIAIAFECTIGGWVMCAATGIPPMVLSIPCTWAFNKWVLPPIDQCNYITCKEHPTPSSYGSLVWTCK